MLYYIDSTGVTYHTKIHVVRLEVMLLYAVREGTDKSVSCSYGINHVNVS